MTTVNLIGLMFGVLDKFCHWKMFITTFPVILLITTEGVVPVSISEGYWRDDCK
jgi:hypothetical protein